MSGKSASTATKKEPPLSDFSKLSDGIYYRPSSATAKDRNGTNENNVSLVIICSWMGASPRHIQKYTLAYRRLYPHASILVVQSTLTDMLLRPSSSQQSRINPARDVLLAEQQDDNKTGGKILLHVFSNGGVNTACQLATAIVASTKPSQSTAAGPIFNAIVLDSCPGLSSHGRTIKAVSASLPPSPVMQILCLMLVRIYLIIVAILTRFFRFENKIMWSRRALNDETLFALAVPRLYIYSSEDEMILWKDVQDHAEEAKQAGYEQVFALPFDKGRHCAHVMEDGQRYWGAVARLVEGEK